MQRKNHLLKKRGVAMIMAIAVIVAISSILALSLSMNTQTTKNTTDTYLYEQSVLLAKSATEYALLRIAQNAPCSNLDENFVQDGIYDVNISIQYIYDSNKPCEDNGGVLYTTVKTPEQNGSALIDVRVGVTSEDIVTEPIAYFRRTLQKL